MEGDELAANGDCCGGGFGGCPVAFCLHCVCVVVVLYALGFCVAVVVAVEVVLLVLAAYRAVNNASSSGAVSRVALPRGFVVEQDCEVVLEVVVADEKGAPIMEQ